VRSIVHVSTDSEFDRTVACERARGLVLSDLDTEIVLYADIDAVGMVVDDAPEAERVRSLIDSGVRVLASQECLELRDVPLESVIDGVELTGDSTTELARLQMEGATYVKT
jgi:intracellular sulfur oxidation DsrE/DsrF family protein